MRNFRLVLEEQLSEKPDKKEVLAELTLKGAQNKDHPMLMDFDCTLDGVHEARVENVPKRADPLKIVVDALARLSYLGVAKVKNLKKKEQPKPPPVV